MGGGIFSIFRKVLNPLNWKCMKKLLLSVVAAFCITASPAQSFEELLAPVHSCCERGNRAMEAKRYAEAEREYREAIRLFETLPDSVRTQLDEWNYGGYLRGEYYNLVQPGLCTVPTEQTQGGCGEPCGLCRLRELRLLLDDRRSRSGQYPLREGICGDCRKSS